MTVHIHGLTRPPTTDERTSERANEATKIERPERRKRARGTATVRSSSATPSLSRPERVAKRQKKPALHAVAGSTRKLRSPSKTGLAPAEVEEEQDEPHVEGASQRAPSTRVRRWDRPAPRRASARTLSDRRGSRSKARPGKRTRSRTAVDEPSTRVPQRQPPNPATTVSPASPVPPPARDPRPAADARKAGKRRPKTRVAPPTRVCHHPTVRGEVRAASGPPGGPAARTQERFGPRRPPPVARHKSLPKQPRAVCELVGGRADPGHRSATPADRPRRRACAHKAAVRGRQKGLLRGAWARLQHRAASRAEANGPRARAARRGRRCGR